MAINFASENECDIICLCDSLGDVMIWGCKILSNKGKWIFRIATFVLIIALVFSVIYSAFAEEAEESLKSFDGEKYSARAFMLVDADTGAVLYEKNADEQLAPASTTKLMTAVIAIEALGLNKEITVPAEAMTTGTLMNVQPGNVLTVETLLYGMLLCSGNDAAVTLAIEISGSQEAFADKMNETAAALGMTNSHFVTASGLDAEGHYVSVRDMSILAQRFLSHEKLVEIAGTTSYVGTTVDKTVSYPMENTNRLLHTPKSEPDANGEIFEYPSQVYEYATGLKTGSTTMAKGCLVASAEKDGQRLIALVYGDSSEWESERWKLARDMFDYGFSAYQNIKLEDFAVEALMVDVVGSAVVDGEALKMKCVPMAETGSNSITLPKDVSPADLEYRVSPVETIAAPVGKDEIVGKVELYYNGEQIFSGNLAAADGIMTAEDYKKLTGTTIIDPISPISAGEEQGVKTQKYVWLWLVVPLIVITFIVIKAVGLNRGRKRKLAAGFSGTYQGKEEASIKAARKQRKQTRQTRPVADTVERRRVAQTRKAAGSGTRKTEVRRTPVEQRKQAEARPVRSRPRPRIT